MRKLYYAIFALLFLFFNSCSDHDSLSVVDSEKAVPNELLLAAKSWYSTQIKLSETDNKNASVNKLKPVWNKASLITQNNGTRLIIVSTPDYRLNNEKYTFLRKVVFVENAGQIIDGYIAEWYGEGNFVKNNEANLKKQIGNSTINGFNGSYITYNVTNYSRRDGRYYKDGVISGTSSLTSGNNNLTSGINDRMGSSLSTESEQECWYVWLRTYYSDGSVTWTFLYSYCLDTGSNPGGGGGTATTLASNFNVNSVYGGNGNKPIAEYQEICSGAQGSWDRSLSFNKEVVSVITADNQVMTVAMLDYSGGRMSGLYMHEGQVYYTYPTSQGVPQRQYAGMITAANQYFIPIRATVHTHSPCLTDGTDGVTDQTLSNGDKNLASSYPSIVHYIIGCDAIGKFKGGDNSASLISTGPLNTTCSLIK